MRIRKRKGTEGPATPRPMVAISAVPFEGVSQLVTLDDPTADAGRARNAFARLRPPEGLPEDETRSWRNVVAGVAVAVKVLPTQRRGVVPKPVLAKSAESGIREEATRLAAETNNPGVISLVETILARFE